MTNILSRLFGRKRSNKDARDSRRADLSRKLRLETMEARQLMATDFFGAVEGNVFTDVNDNGLDAGDTGVTGATVRLYSDVNSDGQLDGGDTLLASQNTDANGDYLFEGLENGDYLVEQVAIANLLQRDSETVKAFSVTNEDGVQAGVVDELTTITTPDPLSAAPGASADDQQTGAANEVIGGERDVQLVNDGGSGSDLEFDIDPSGQVIIDAGVATTGDVFITYDGVDGSATTIGHNLGGIDLTANLGRAFQFRVGSQVGSLLTVEVYSGNDNTASSLTLVLPTTAGGAATEDLHFCFEDFTRLAGATADADFTNVSAIRLHANMAAADDIAIDFVGIQGLAAAEANFANLEPMSIGDQVFLDNNNNGLLDGTDAGIQGVTVQLFEDTNANGTFDSGTDQQVPGASVTTDANGNYLFTDLFPGEYIAVIPFSELDTGGTLVGFASSSGNDPAPDPDNDVDNDDNGTLIAGVAVATQAITLAAGSEPTDDGDQDENSNLSVDFGFTPLVDLEVQKTASSSVVTAGNQFTYTITVENVGQSTANNVIVVDNLPELSPTDLSIISINSSLGGTITETGDQNGEIEVTYASLAAGQSDTITVVVEVPDSAAAAAAITNIVTVDADEAETNEQNNQAEVSVEIVREAVLQITKTDTPDPNTVGSTLTYEVVVTNTGSSTATNVVISDTLPTGLTLVSSSITTGTTTDAGNTVTGNIATLGVGESATITIQATINENFTGTTLSNTATANADEAEEVSSNATTTVSPLVDLSIIKVDDVDPNNRNGRLVYTLTIENDGPSTATGVQVVDTLPEDVTFVSATGGTVTAPATGSRDVTVDIGTLASGGTATVTITVDINADAPDQITNTATVTSTETDENPQDNSTSETTDLNPAIDLVIDKAASPTSVIAGNDLVYTMTITNDGPSTATNVQFTDTLPAGVTVTNVTSSQGSVSNDNGVVSGNLGTLAADATATVTITVGVNSTTTGSLTNTASVSADETELITTNNQDSVTTTVTQNVDLQIEKVDNTTTVTNGSDLTYTLTVTNNGPSTATNVVVTDNLPSELSFVSGTTTVGTLTNTGNNVSVNLGTLAPNGTATIVLNTTVVGTGFGTITNTASVAAAEAESITANNTDSDSVELSAPSLSKRRLLASSV